MQLRYCSALLWLLPVTILPFLEVIRGTRLLEQTVGQDVLALMGSDTPYP